MHHVLQVRAYQWRPSMLGKRIAAAPSSMGPSRMQQQQRCHYPSLGNRPAAGMNGLQGSQLHRRVDIHKLTTPTSRNAEMRFDRSVETTAAKQGLFRPDVPLKCTCRPGTDHLRATGSKLVKSFISVVKLLTGACEP